MLSTHRDRHRHCTIQAKHPPFAKTPPPKPGSTDTGVETLFYSTQNRQNTAKTPRLFCQNGARGALPSDYTTPKQANGFTQSNSNNWKRPCSYCSEVRYPGLLEAVSRYRYVQYLY